VAAHQPAHPPAQRQAGDTGGRHHAARGGLPVHVRRPVVLVPRDPALGARPTPVRVDVDPTHRRQIDHQPTVGYGPSGNVVATTANGDLDAEVAPQVHRVTDIAHRLAAGDQPGTLVDQAVVNSASVVIAGVSGTEQHSVERRRQLVRHHQLDHRLPPSPTQARVLRWSTQ
jgi:hypothetical protein